MIITDRETCDPERFGGIIRGIQGGRAGFKRNRGVKQFEHRAHFIDAQRAAVEPRIRRRLTGAVRVKVGKGRHGDDFAGVDIHHKPGGPDRTVGFHRTFDFFLKRVLHPGIDRQLQRAVVDAQFVIEFAFGTGNAVIIDVGKAEHV